MTTNSKEKKTNKIKKKDLIKGFTRSCTLDASWNYERMQNISFGYTMAPFIERVYDDPEDQARALNRHLEFFSTTPHISTFLVGLLAKMEERNATDESFDESSINAVKASLMGPMAAVGDSLIWGTLRIIAAGIAISFATQGNILGPILFLLIINVPAFALRWFCLNQGYSMGTKYFEEFAESGAMEKISRGASILGLLVIGAMAATMIYFELPLQVGAGDFAMPLQSYLNEIMPGLLPLGLFGIMYYLLGKKMKTTTLLVGIFVVAILGSFLGIM